MEFPPRAQAIVDALWAMNTPLATGDLNQQRLLTRLMAEQICFELGPLWGCKASTPTNPQGPSNIAFNAATGLVGFRWSDGDGSVTHIPGAPLHPPVFLDLAGQHFIPVEPIDHLRTVPEPAPTPPAAPSAPTDPMAILASLARVDARLAALEARLSAVAAKVPPPYTGSLGPLKISLKPDLPH